MDNIKQQQLNTKDRNQKRETSQIIKKEEEEENDEIDEIDEIDDILEFNNLNIDLASSVSSFSTNTSNNTNTIDTIDNNNGKRHRLHKFLDDPKSSKPALYYSICMLLIILVSTIAFLVSSLPQYYGDYKFKVMQVVTGSIFTLDYFLRLVTADCWYRWAILPFSLLDLFIVVPFVLNLTPNINLDNEFIALRAIRLLYVLKIIKMTKYIPITQVVLKAFKKSKDGFVVLTLGLIIMCLFFATLIFIAENTGERFEKDDKTWYHPDGTVSDFQSIFDAMWWCIVTFTTVGYGDKTVVTPPGKVVASFAMLAGLLFTALPVAIFTANFTELWKEHKQKKRSSRHSFFERRDESMITKKMGLHNIMKEIEKKEKDMQEYLQTTRETIQQLSKTHKQLHSLLVVMKSRTQEQIQELDVED